MKATKPVCLTLAALAALALVLSVLGGCGNGESEAEKDYQEGSTTGKRTIIVKEADLGVPIYPGAKLNEKATVEDNSGLEGNWEATEAVLTSDDPADKVIAWYRSELSSKPGFEDLSTNEGGNETGMYYFPVGADSRTVVVTENKGGGTKITVTLQKDLDK